MTSLVTRDDDTTVLVAEDDDDLRALIGEVLDGLGLATRAVGRGVDALLAVRSQVPRLLVLDGTMPGLDGLAVCRHLRASAIGRDLLVLIVSGDSTPEDVAAGYAAGADDFLPKPFTCAQLATRVQGLLTGASR
jgi:CheY-like chemotaxis protein